MVVVVKTTTDHCPDGLVIVLKSGAEKCVPRGKREAKTCPDGHLLIVLKSGAEKCVPRGKREAKTCPDGQLLIVLCLGLRSVFPEEKERHRMAQWSTRKRERLTSALTISGHVRRIAMETKNA